jgi:nucleoside phosphorylase
MEAFAIGSVLDLFGTLDRMICIKAISDGADSEAKGAHMDNLDFAMQNSIVVLKEIIQ